MVAPILGCRDEPKYFVEFLAMHVDDIMKHSETLVDAGVLLSLMLDFEHLDNWPNFVLFVDNLLKQNLKAIRV